MKILKLIIISILLFFTFGVNFGFSGEYDSAISNIWSPSSTPDTTTSKPWPTLENAQKLQDAENWKNSPSNLWSSKFELKVSSLMPLSEDSKTNYIQSDSKKNITSLLKKITTTLLIFIPSLATLFIVIWWLKIVLAWWDSSKINNGKTIVQYNIMAIVISLLSYSIINLVTWVLWSTF